jgi:hypothetical protein
LDPDPDRYTARKAGSGSVTNENLRIRNPAGNCKSLYQLSTVADWAASNFAVNKEGKLFLIDLENIIIVNQTRLRNLRAPGTR